MQRPRSGSTLAMANDQDAGHPGWSQVDCGLPYIQKEETWTLHFSWSYICVALPRTRFPNKYKNTSHCWFLFNLQLNKHLNYHIK